MDYEQIACKELKKNLKEIMTLSFSISKEKQEAYTVNHLAHECEKIVNKLESHSKRPK
tara:strand:- start:3337 stop:3510 length:174 start_codon:yes stop_codon:yes gene_type:complete